MVCPFCVPSHFYMRLPECMGKRFDSLPALPIRFRGSKFGRLPLGFVETEYLPAEYLPA